MVTTDTDQTITANKVFQGNYDIRLQSGATYTSSDTLITNQMVSASQIGGTMVSAGELVFADSTTQQNSQIRVRDFTQTPFVDYRIEVPTKNGTMALTSDIPTIPTNVSAFNNDAGYITKSVNDLTNYTLSSNLATVATSGSYNDLSNKPTIPVVDYPVTDVQVNGTSVVTNKVASLNSGKKYTHHLTLFNNSNVGSATLRVTTTIETNSSTPFTADTLKS